METEDLGLVSEVRAYMLIVVSKSSQMVQIILTFKVAPNGRATSNAFRDRISGLLQRNIFLVRL